MCTSTRRAPRSPRTGSMAGSNRPARFGSASKCVYHRSLKGIRCIRPQTRNSNDRYVNSRGGAQSPSKTDRPRRHGGGDRRLRWFACGNRCRPTGAPDSNCPMAPRSPMARRCFSRAWPTRYRCPGPAVFPAMQAIRIRPSYQRPAAASLRFGCRAVFPRGPSAAG